MLKSNILGLLARGDGDSVPSSSSSSGVTVTAIPALSNSTRPIGESGTLSTIGRKCSVDRLSLGVELDAAAAGML
jgi:hypothetical protein